MQIVWRRNPKTEDGWPRRIAISLLAALALFLLSIPVSFIIALNHLQNSYPGDTQNLLGALTTAVIIGLAFACLSFLGVVLVLYLISLRSRPATR